MTGPAVVTPLGRMRALVAYLPWHARDGLLKAAVPLGLFVLVAGLPLAFMIRNVSLEVLRTPGRWQTNAMQVYGQSLPMVLLLGAIVLMSGAASLDRERQHVRFLFPRPIAPWAFYLQQFAVSLVLYVSAVAIIPWGFGALIADVPIMPVVRTASLFGLLYGSLGLLCGALLNRDGVVFIALIVVSGTLQQVAQSTEVGRVIGTLADVLPPIGAAGQVRIAWFAERAAESADLRLVTLYSLGMLAVALFVIQRRPLVR
jgi:hypothetical protein